MFSRKRRREHSSLRIFIRLFAWAHKKARQSRQRVEAIQSVLCEDALPVKRTVVV